MANKTLGEVAKYLNGRAFKPSEWEECGLPIIRIQNLNDESAKYNYTSNVYEDRYLVKNGDLLFAWSASLGAFIWNGSDAWLNQHIFKVVPFDGINKMYLYYYLLHVIDELYSKTHGSGMVHITLKPFKETVPHLYKQRCIVDVIESLFEKLDKSKDLIQSVMNSFENRKAAILHKAFTGKLTVKWREENGVRLEDWEETQLKKVVSGFRYGTSDKSDYSYSGMPVIRIPNIISNTVDFLDIKYLSHNNIADESQVHKNDILVIRSNGSRDLVGKCALVPYIEKEYAYASYLIRLRPQKTIEASFLLYFLNSTIARVQLFSKSKSSAGINNINTKELGAIIINLPSLPEQQEIVRLLDNLLAYEQKAKDLCNVIEKIDLLKKAILARAFRGELGTNDPNEESAVNLLKECIQIKLTDKNCLG